MAKQVKFSGRCKKTRNLLRSKHEKLSNQRKDFAHKLSTQVVKESSVITTEKLNLVGMSSAGRTEAGNTRKTRKRHLNKSLRNAAFGQTLDMIRYKAKEAGIGFTEVETKKYKPPQTCPVCLHQYKKLLSDRIHDCNECGLLIGRDEASAIYLWRINEELSGAERSIVEDYLRKALSECFKTSRPMKRETMTITLS